MEFSAVNEEARGVVKNIKVVQVSVVLVGAWNTRENLGRGEMPMVHMRRREVLVLLVGRKTNMLALDIVRFDSFLHEGRAESLKRWRGKSDLLG